jgi:NADPH-dependent curcumin reductase
MDPCRQVILAARPKGLPRPGDFRLETGPMPELLEGQVLVATKFLSLDPYMRGRMNDTESHAPPVNVGGVMAGEVVAEVVRSRHPSFSRGELVQGRIGWGTHASRRETCKG